MKNQSPLEHLKVPPLELPPILEIKDLSFGYTQDFLLDNVTFRIAKGDFVAVIGSNGGGKSTLLKLIFGLLTPNRGQIFINGILVDKNTNFSHVGYLPQNSGSMSANFPATALEIVLTGLYPEIGFLRLVKKQHKAKALEALTQVGMEDYAHQMIGKLSGGQQQRVMLAKVLVGKPELIILDEPTTGVDRKNVEILVNILTDLNLTSQTTLLIVTHDLDLIAHKVNRILCLSQRNFAENSLPENLIVHAHSNHHIKHDYSETTVCPCHQEVN